MWDLPGPGLKPVSPALAGGFLTTVPPGKPQEGPYLMSNPYLQVAFLSDTPSHPVLYWDFGFLGEAAWVGVLASWEGVGRGL